MNARVSAPAVHVPPWCPELEREVLGLILLGETIPDWVTAEHFFPAIHQRIFSTAREFARPTLPLVAARLREGGLTQQFDSTRQTSAADLAEMVMEATSALRFGWAIEFDKLRELADQRRLLSCMQRVEIQLRGRAIRMREARVMLKEAMGE